MEETPAKKKFRENPDLAKTSVTSDIIAGSSDSSNEDKKSTPTMPSLVSQIFLINLKDVKLLKTCRLVCKLWNIDATFSLKACSKVSLEEDLPNVTQIRDFILKRESGPFNNLPSPFHNFQAKGREFTQPAFNELLLRPNITITTLRFPLFSYQRIPTDNKLGLILSANQNNITELILNTFEPDARVYEQLLEHEEMKPKGLKCFRIDDQCDQCSHIPFLNNFLNLCKLERIDFTISDEKIVISLLTKDNVRNLKHLAISTGEMSVQALTFLSNKKFLQLESLSFETELVNETSYLQQLCLFYESVSPILKYFATNVPISNIFDLRFLNLRKIQVRNNTVLSGLNSDSFPVLSKVSLVVARPLLLNLGNDVNPHSGVQYVTITITDQKQDQLFVQDLLLLLTYLSRQFPNVSTLVFRNNGFSCSDLMAICESFPRLTTLCLGGDCFKRFFCFEDNNFRRFFPQEKIPLLTSIMNCTELESVLFDLDFFIHPDLIIHWLPSLPKLKQVTLHWKTYLSAKLIRKSLGHLEKIYIHSSTWIVEMIIALKLLPNVYLL